MNIILTRLQSFLKLIFPKKPSICLTSIFLSIFSSFLFLVASIPFIYNKIPHYSELMLSDPVWTAYYKYGDLFIIKFYLLTFTLLFFITSYFFNKSNFNFSLATKLIAFFERMNNIKIFLCAWLVYLILTALINSPPLNELAFFSIASLTYYNLKNTLNYYSDKFIYYLLILIFLQFLLVAIFNILLIYFKNNFHIINIFYNIFRSFCYLTPLLLLKYQHISSKFTPEKLIVLLQLPLPIILISLPFNFYEYNNTIIEQFFSLKYYYLICLFIITMLIYNIYIYRIKTINPNLIFPSTFISLSIYLSYKTPSGSLLSDFFHNGELSVPFQQLFTFDVKPFIDYIPIHGLYDYFYRFIGYLFYDNTYTSLAPATSLSEILIVGLMSIIFYFAKIDKLISFLIILSFSYFFPLPFTLRMIFIPIFTILIFNQYNKNFLDFLLYWLIASIITILWYPAIGGVIVLSSLPFFLAKFYNDNLNNNVGINKKSLIKLSLVILLIILLIPVWKNIMVFICENSPTIIETTSNSLLDTITKLTKRNESIFILIFSCFGFVPLLSVSIFSLTYFQKNRYITGSIIIYIIIFTLLIINYTLGRAGVSRVATSTSLLFITLVPLILNNHLNTEIKYKRVAISFLIFFFFLCRLITPYNTELFYLKDFPQIPNDYLYIDGQNFGMDNLGSIYTDKFTIQDLNDINYIVSNFSNNNTDFFDMSHAIAYYYLLNKKNPIPYSSSFNLHNEIIQSHAISYLKNNPPSVILIYSGINYSGPRGFDTIVTPLKNFHLYRWLVNQGYYPYRYNDKIFLLKSKPKILNSTIEDGVNQMTIIDSKYDLGYLPFLWGSEDIKERFTSVIESNANIISLNGLIFKDNHYSTISNNPYIDFKFTPSISGKEIDFIRLKINSSVLNSKNEYTAEISFSDNNTFTKTKSHSFVIKNGELLLPLSANPSWIFSNDIKIIRISFLNLPLNTIFEMNFDFEKFSQQPL